MHGPMNVKKKKLFCMCVCVFYTIFLTIIYTKILEGKFKKKNILFTFEVL